MPRGGRKRATGEVLQPFRSSADISKRFPALSPYTVTKITENTERIQDPALRRLVEDRLRDGWTIAKVATLSTEELETRVRALGVRHSRESFAKLSAGLASAWSIADAWGARDGLRLASDDEDWLGLAACELWKRYLPDRPSMEMLDDWMQEGYALNRQNRFAEACDIWWKVWSVLRTRFDSSIRRMPDADSVFRGLQSVFNWSQDFVTALNNAAIKDRRYAETGRTYVQEWLAQFTAEDASMQVGFHQTLATFQFLLGDVAGGEATLLAAVGRWPKEPWAHIHVADAYLGTFKFIPSPPRDEVRARAHLERALALAGPDQGLQDAARHRLSDIPPPEQVLATGREA
jgi:hypothetical protein